MSGTESHSHHHHAHGEHQHEYSDQHHARGDHQHPGAARPTTWKAWTADTASKPSRKLSQPCRALILQRWI